jgi:hypothetical protein
MAKNFGEPTDHERTSLDAHVDLCAMRYQALDGRLQSLETKVDRIHDDISSNNSKIITTIIATSGTMVVGIGSVILTIIFT